MTKAEIITRIIDRITDPWTESPEDYQYAELIDLDVAKDIIAQCREEDYDLEPEERLPQETTPELMMEAFNCNVRHQKHELQILRLAEYITENEMVCEYTNYYMPTLEHPLDVVPIEFMETADVFPFSVEGTFNPDYLSILLLGKRSRNTFDPNDEYCWFNEETKQLYSTNAPFHDGVLDAEAFARFALSDRETIKYLIDCMPETDAEIIFGKSKEEALKEVTC